MADISTHNVRGMRHLLDSAQMVEKGDMTLAQMLDPDAWDSGAVVVKTLVFLFASDATAIVWVRELTYDDRPLFDILARGARAAVKPRRAAA